MCHKVRKWDVELVQEWTKVLVDICPFLIDTTFDESDHRKVFEVTQSASDGWRAIGWKLGFTEDQLDAIVHEPGRHGEMDYYRAMLRRWLDWAPPDHPYPSLQTLTSALHAVGKERQASALGAVYNACCTVDASH